MLRCILLLAILLLNVLLSCTSDIAGGTTDSGNAFTLAGVVRNPDGKPQADAVVSVRKIVITLNRDSVIAEYITTTDSGGNFQFSRLPNGDYVVYTEDRTGRYVSEVLQVNSPENRTLIKDTVQLQQSVYVQGRVIRRDDEDIAGTVVFIPGTNSRSYIDSSGVYRLRSVPQGKNIISFVSGVTVNYLPLTINKSYSDTILCKDITLKTDTGTVVRNYHPYATTLSKSLAIVPREYKPESAPQWYEGKDIQSIEYYQMEGIQKVPYTPDPKQILYIGRYSNNDVRMVNRLEQNGYTVFLMRDDIVTENDTTGMDLLYIANSVDTATIQSLFKMTPIPLMTADHQYPQLIDMATMPTEGYITRAVRIVDSTHVLAAGLSDYVLFASQAWRVQYAIPSQQAYSIGVHPNEPELSCIFAYEKGDTMLTIAAPAKRLGFFIGTQNFNVMREEGWKLFDTAIRWMIEP